MIPKPSLIPGKEGWRILALAADCVRLFWIGAASCGARSATWGMQRRPWWAWCCAVGAPLLCVPGQLVPGPSFQPFYGVANVMAVLVIVTAGMVALGEPGQTRNGVVMLGIALMIASDCLGNAATGPWEFTSLVLEPFDGLLFLLLLLRWPKERLQTRLQVRMFRLGIVVVPALYLADALTRTRGWDPRPNRTTWWPKLIDDLTVNTWITNVRITVEIVLLRPISCWWR